MNEFEQREAERKEARGMDNEEFLELVSTDLADAKAMVVVADLQDGTIVSYSAQDSSVEVLGLLEVGKAQIISDMETPPASEDGEEETGGYYD